MNSKQDVHKPTSTYVEEVTKRFDVLKAANGSLLSKQLVQYILRKYYKDKYANYDAFKVLSAEDKEPVYNRAEQVMLATIIIDGSNDKQYRNMSRELADQYTLGMDNYPCNAFGAQEMLN